jgi:hypothetical protein
MKKERTITALLNLKGRVYVYLANKAIAERFMKDAEDECFAFGDGVKPTERETDDIIALNKDHTINYLGWCGHLAFKNPKAFCPRPLIRVDYIKYITGEKHYFYKD